MKQIFMKFEEEENEDTADLYIYGDIVDEAIWEDEISAIDIRKKLTETNAQLLNIHINSLGGSTYTAIAIYNLLREKSKTAKIVVYVDAIAASAASIIAMAGDEIKMPTNTLMMIHNCWTVGIGNSKELRKTADDMEKVMTAVVKCYLSKVSITESELRILLDNETILTAQEALEKGFCSEVIQLQEDKGKQHNALSSLTKIVKESKEKSKNKSNARASLFNLK